MKLIVEAHCQKKCFLIAMNWEMAEAMQLADKYSKTML